MMHARGVLTAAVVIATITGASVVFSLPAAGSAPDDSSFARPDDASFESVEATDLPTWLMIAGSSRPESLDNDVRRRVYEAIERSPGTYPAALGEATGIPRSTIRYHLGILEKEGLVFSENIRGKKRYFPRGNDDVELSAALEDDVCESVLVAIGRSEPVSVSALAAVLDRAPSTVSYHLARLADAGVVEQEYADGQVLNSLSADARRALSRRIDGVRVEA